MTWVWVVRNFYDKWKECYITFLTVDLTVFDKVEHYILYISLHAF